jgi:hypothetical protein
MRLRDHAREMRDMYANEIAAAVAEGRDPSPLQVESWVKYAAAVSGTDPSSAFAPESR